MSLKKDPYQFASQVTGRLLPYRDSPAIHQFIAKIAAGVPTPWLRPRAPAPTRRGAGLNPEPWSPSARSAQASSTRANSPAPCYDRTIAEFQKHSITERKNSRVAASRFQQLRRGPEDGSLERFKPRLDEYF